MLVSKTTSFCLTSQGQGKPFYNHMKEPGAARMKKEPRKKQVLGSGGAGNWILHIRVIIVITSTGQSTVSITVQGGYAYYLI